MQLLAALTNLASSSSWERYLWGPVALIMAVLCLVVARGAAPEPRARTSRTDASIVRLHSCPAFHTGAGSPWQPRPWFSGALTKPRRMRYGGHTPLGIGRKWQIPMREVGMNAFAAAHAGGAVVIDVREPYEYLAGHVPGPGR